MAKMFQLNVHIPKEMNEALVDIASERGIHKSELIRRFLKDSIKDYYSDDGVETAYDSMTIDLEKRVKKLEEKEEQSWWKRMITK